MSEPVFLLEDRAGRPAELGFPFMREVMTHARRSAARRSVLPPCPSAVK